MDLLNDRFGRVDCRNCGAAVRTEPVMLYTDFPRRQFYALFPDNTFAQRERLEQQILAMFHHHFRIAAAPIVQSWAPEFRVRLVFGPERLREKLICDDAGLDDRLLEIGKVGLIRDVSPAHFSWRVSLTLRDAHADTLVFALARPLDDRNELLREFSVERAWYDALASSAADWRARFPEAFDRPTVDFRSWFARSVSNV